MANADNDNRNGLPSASSMSRTVNCPGWQQLAAQCPKPKEDALATAGTRIHAAMESDDDEGLDLTESQIAERLRGLRQQAIDKFVFLVGDQTRGDAEPMTELREQRVWLRNSATLAKEVSAKVDDALVTKDAALILDFKTGFKPPTDSESSWQVRTQVACLWDENPQLTRIYAGFAASRLYDKLDLALYTPADRDAITADIRRAIWRANLPDASRYPGDWCNLCPAKGLCRESASYSALVEYELGNGKMTAADVSLSVAKLTPAGLRLIWEKTSTITAITEAVKERLKDMTDEELKAIGLRKKPGAERRVVENGEVVLQRLSGIKGASRFFKPVWADLDQHVMNVLGLSEKQAKSEIEKLLGDAMVKVQNQPSIAKMKSLK